MRLLQLGREHISMIYAIDPGTTQSALIKMPEDTMQPFAHMKLDNDSAIELIRSNVWGLQAGDTVVIEMVASYGMPVGAEVFETCVWIGRFEEAAKARGANVVRMFRRDVKWQICNSSKASDANIRQALIDRFGVVGTKKRPGWFYGFKADIWQAYALGVAYLDKLREDAAEVRHG